jgi:hypothetical protein
MGKTVLLLGAGASVADVATRPKKSRPPLDHGFFRVSAGAGTTPWFAHHVREYMQGTYGIDIFMPQHDSLEGVMSRLYPDLFSDLVASDALKAFQALIKLFTGRLAQTTNDLHATHKSLLYRIVSNLLVAGADPADITILTFNQDIQAEKILERLAATQRWNSLASRLFSFPNMYSMAPGALRSTGTRTQDAFAASAEDTGILRVLKLHGSLNWFSKHNSSNPSRTAMLDPHRRLFVTRRRRINVEMKMSGKRATYALPVIVPPVNHKSAVLPTALRPVWGLAERRLVDADHIVVFGYSCPALDFESANLLTRAYLQNKTCRVSVVDPNGAVATRFIDLLSPQRLSYYSTAHSFLA